MLERGSQPASPSVNWSEGRWMEGPDGDTNVETRLGKGNNVRVAFCRQAGPACAGGRS